MALRGCLTVYVNLCWGIGKLISAGAQVGFSSGTSQWSMPDSLCCSMGLATPALRHPLVCPRVAVALRPIRRLQGSRKEHHPPQLKGTGATVKVESRHDDLHQRNRGLPRHRHLMSSMLPRTRSSPH